MSLWRYPEVRIQREAVYPTHSFIRKFCGCMSLRPGCALASALWIGLHLYCAILAFRYSNPIFSYLNEYALVVFGAVCLLFVMAAIFSLISLFVESGRLLRTAHRLVWVIVVIFLMDYFGTIIVFSIEEDDYTDWCIRTARAAGDNRIIQANGTVTAIPSTVDTEIFNCHKLWEDELKLAIAVYIIVLICYLYWATCLWSFAQKILAVQLEVSAITARGGPLPQPGIAFPPPPGPPMTGIMGNLKPNNTGSNNIMVLDDGTLPISSFDREMQLPPPVVGYEYDDNDDNQKSAAQHARILFQKLKSKLSA